MKNTNPVDEVLNHLEIHGSITNRDCRKLFGLSTDHAILLLGGLCKVGLLTRKGISSGTHYVLSGKKVPFRNLNRFKEDFLKHTL